MAQNLCPQLTAPISLHQKQFKSYLDNNSDMDLIESANPLNLDGDRECTFP